MKVQKFAVSDASFDRSPGQVAEVFAGNVIDQRHGGPVTIGYGRYGPDQRIEEQIAVHDTMIILEGRVSVTSDGVTLTAGAGEILYMPRGNAVVIQSHEEGALTAYVTYPHWQQPDETPNLSAGPARSWPNNT